MDLDRYRLGGHLGVLEGAARLGLPGVPGKGLAYTTDAMLQGTPNYSQALNSILADPSTLKVKVSTLPQTKSNWLSDLATFATGAVGLFTGNYWMTAGAAGKGFLGDMKTHDAIARSNAMPTKSVFPSLSEIAPVGQTPYTEGGIMFEDLFDNVAGFFDTGSWDVDWSSVLDVGSDLASNYFAGGAVATPALAASGPAMRAAGGAVARTGGAVVGRGFFNRFPALAVGIQKLRNAGQNVTRAKLYAMVKKFGPEFIISGGILTAAAVNELMLAGPGHRRMNPANSKALRRSIRRVQSFHRLCQKADVIASHAKRRRCK